MRRMIIAAAALFAAIIPASAQTVRGEDAQACLNGGPAIRVNVLGLKDRTGRLKLELYPPNERDFLRSDFELQKAGLLFHRSFAPTPKTGDVVLCIAVPRAGSYGLFLTHDRDGVNKFNFWQDGAGFPSNRKMGRQRPKLADGLVQAGGGVTTITIRAQYLRGLSGFGPLKD